MDGDQSLQNILNVVASTLATGDIAPKKTERASGSSSTLTEFDAFAALDPLLADLQKQYRNAKAQRLQAAREYGSDDPMTDMAVYTEDSAWCAMQTRYMEVRADRAMMKTAQQMMWESEEEERAAAQAEKDKTAFKFAMYMQMVERMRPQERDENGAWWALFYILSQKSYEDFRPYQHAWQFNRLAA